MLSQAGFPSSSYSSLSGLASSWQRLLYTYVQLSEEGRIAGCFVATYRTDALCNCLLDRAGVSVSEGGLKKGRVEEEGRCLCMSKIECTYSMRV